MLDQEPSSLVASALRTAFSFFLFLAHGDFCLVFETGDVYYCCVFGAEQRGTLKHGLTVLT